jgi:hypothetical protein
VYFQAIPPQQDTTVSQPAAPDWNALFSSAELDPSKFQPTPPQWNALGGADVRAAWTGVWPGTTRPLRVEAAAWRGKPVFFALVGDWNKPWRMVAPPSGDDSKRHASLVIGLSLLILLLIAGALLARRNFRHGRGDREGALRLAAVFFVLELALCLCRSHLVLGFETFGALMFTIASGLLWGGIMWMLYLAIEPWIRRRWPHALISWSRMLSGQFRDPVVCRDILIGVVFGVVWILIFELSYIPLARMGAAPGLSATAYLVGGRAALGQWLLQIPTSIFGTLEFFFLLLGLKVLLRKDWLAAIAFVSIFVGMRALQASHLPVVLPAIFLVYAVLVLIVFRFGLVPLAVAAFTVDMLANVPFTSDFSAWYMTNTLLALFSVIALAGWGFYHSLGGQTLWRMEED